MFVTDGSGVDYSSDDLTSLNRFVAGKKANIFLVGSNRDRRAHMSRRMACMLSINPCTFIHDHQSCHTHSKNEVALIGKIWVEVVVLRLNRKFGIVLTLPFANSNPMTPLVLDPTAFYTIRTTLDVSAQCSNSPSWHSRLDLSL